MTSTSFIQQLNLLPHPEGGYFREIYRNEKEVPGNLLSEQYSGNRNLATSIYFLLESGQVSKLHQLKSDEIWYYHTGSPLHVHIFSGKNYKKLTLGPDVEKNQKLQIIIPAGSIFGAEVILQQSFTLMGCMVSPGFHFDDFRLVTGNELYSSFPEHKSIIKNLTS